MFFSNWKLAWRNLVRDKYFSLLNLAGLSTGLACALLIFLWVNDERGIDRFHQNNSQLFQVMKNQQNGDGIHTGSETSALLARTLKEELPEVRYAAASLSTGWFGVVTLSTGQTGTMQNNVNAQGHFADADFFHLFSYPLVQGDADHVLKNNQSIVISAELAKKLFHSTGAALGQTLQWQHETTYKVTGVFENNDSRSSDHFDFVLPMDKFLEMMPWQKDWGKSSDPATYVLLKPGTDIAQFNRKIAGLMEKKAPGSREMLFARPYADGYLFGQYENGKAVGGRIAYVRLFSIIAVFILVIACINFMNLATAKSSRRMKEVGIRKVVGSGRLPLIVQYLSESVLMSLISLCIALVLVWFILPAFNRLTGKELLLSFQPGFLMMMAAITLLTGVIAGSYPAFYLSGFRPVAVLKGKLSGTAGELWIRKGLVIFQFTLTVIFIVGILVVYQQVRFIQNKQLGYNRDNLLSFNMRDLPEQQTVSFLSELKNQPGVINASTFDHADLYTYGTSVPMVEGKLPADMVQISNVGVNYGMLETLNMQLITGRPFSKQISSDTAEVILNQAAVDAFGLKDPIGKQIEVFRGDGKRRIVGVVKNFHFQSLHENVRPFALRLVPYETNGVLVKIKAGTEKQTIARTEALFNRFHPGYPFHYRFLDATFQSQYVAENRVSVLSKWFGGLAIIISCLGLFGLAAFATERRFREIGIRKVLGGTTQSLVWLLTAEFLQLVAISVFVAFPLAWWATNQWLNGFAYRIHTGPAVFLIAAVSILLITVITVGFQSVKAALANPVKSMRAE